MDTGHTAHPADEQIVELFWQRDEAAIRASDEKYGRRLMIRAKP